MSELEPIEAPPIDVPIKLLLSYREIEMLLDACYLAKETSPRGSKAVWNDIIKRLEGAKKTILLSFRPH